MLGHSMLGGWGDGPKRISGVSCVRSSAGQFQVSTPQGPMNVTVPPGVVPGQSFAFQLPPVVATPVSAMPSPSPRPHPHAHPCPDPTLVLTTALALATATSSAPRYPPHLTTPSPGGPGCGPAGCGRPTGSPEAAGRLLLWLLLTCSYLRSTWPATGGRGPAAWPSPAVLPDLPACYGGFPSVSTAL